MNAIIFVTLSFSCHPVTPYVIVTNQTVAPKVFSSYFLTQSSGYRVQSLGSEGRRKGWFSTEIVSSCLFHLRATNFFQEALTERNNKMNHFCQNDNFFVEPTFLAFSPLTCILSKKIKLQPHCHFLATNTVCIFF